MPTGNVDDLLSAGRTFLNGGCGERDVVGATGCSLERRRVIVVERLRELSGKLIFLTWTRNAARVSAAGRMYFLFGADEVLFDLAFQLDAREEHIPIDRLVLAEEMNELGLDSAVPGYIAPVAAWELFRAIIAVASDTPQCWVKRIRADAGIARNQVSIETPRGLVGDLHFWGPGDASARARVTWEIQPTLWQIVSALSTVRAIETVLFIDPADRPLIGPESAGGPPSA